jgi:hypothetical protein
MKTITLPTSRGMSPLPSWQEAVYTFLGSAAIIGGLAAWPPMFSVIEIVIQSIRSQQYIIAGIEGYLKKSVTLFSISVACLSLSAIVAFVATHPYIRMSARGFAVALIAFAFWYLSAGSIVFAFRADSIFLGIPIGLFGFNLIRYGSIIFSFAHRNMLPSVEHVMKADRRRPILYLRSFAFDQDDVQPVQKAYLREGFLTWRVITPQFWIRRRILNFEEILCKGLKIIGPVLALGQPGERLPKIGAVRKYVSEFQWHNEVLNMLHTSCIICLVVGTSRGLLWELEQLIEGDSLAKTLFIIPQSPQAVSIWTDFCREANQRGLLSSFPLCLPDNTLAVFTSQDLEPIVVTGFPSFQNYQRLAQHIYDKNISKQPLTGASINRPSKGEVGVVQPYVGDITLSFPTVATIADIKKYSKLSWVSAVTIVPTTALGGAIGALASGTYGRLAGIGLTFLLAVAVELYILTKWLNINHRILLVCRGLQLRGNVECLGNEILLVYEMLKLCASRELRQRLNLDRLIDNMLKGLNALSMFPKSDDYGLWEDKFRLLVERAMNLAEQVTKGYMDEFEKSLLDVRMQARVYSASIIKEIIERRLMKHGIT